MNDRSRTRLGTINSAAVMVALTCLTLGCGMGPSSDGSREREASNPAEAERPEIPTGGIELPPMDELENAAENPSKKPDAIELPPFDQPADDSVKGDSVKGEPVLETRIRIEPWPETLKAVKNSGIFVVDLWSLACPPCMAEFPALVRLHREFGDDSKGESMDRRVECLAVSLDYVGRKSRPPTWYREKVMKFLASVDAGDLPVVISSTPSDEILADVDASSIPTVLVFQNGKLVKKFVDAGETLGFSYDHDVAPLVKSLVK